MTQGSVGTSFGAGMFPGQMLQGFTNQSPMFQGPTGVMMPMSPAAAFNAYPGMNPYAGLAARGPYQGAPGLFTPMAPLPPPVYAGQMAQMTPLMPPPAMAMFNTGYGAALERYQVAQDTGFLQGVGAGGVFSRLSTNMAAGVAGAAIGGRFGGNIGAVLGGFTGFIGSEMSGLGQGAQNLFMNQVGVPLIQQRGAAGGIEELSRGFISSGPDLHARGYGFSHHAAAQVANGLREMAASESFQRETGGRFNQQDLLKITQQSARNDMFTGVQNADQMTGRVRDVAKSLTSFMQLAQEPDIQRAIQTMGQLRASGLNLAETMNAVSSGRAFARMAGQSFADIMSQAGGMGSQTYQAMGLSQGVGLQAGMANYALARSSITAGTLNPLLSNLVGGAQGLAGMNNMFGASMLQMPMLAPSIMSASGGVNQAMLSRLLGGQMSPFAQTSQAAAALQAMTGRQGVGGLGMAIAMQPYMQSFLAQQLQMQGPFAQRNFEDQNIFGLMRNMNLHGAGGAMTAAQIMGLSGPAAQARIGELNSPAYFERQRQQLEVNRLEGRQAEFERRAAMAPGFFSTAMRDLDIDPAARMYRMGQGISQFFSPHARSHYLPTTDQSLIADRQRLGSSEFQDFIRSIESRSGRNRDVVDVNGQFLDIGGRARTGLERFGDRLQISRARGYGGLAALTNMAIGSFGSERAQLSEMADIREGARYAGLIASTSNQEMTRGFQTLERQFGTEGASQISQHVANALATRLNRQQSGLGNTGTSLFNLVGGTALSMGVGGAIGGPLGLVAGAVTGLSGAGNLFGHRALTGTDVQESIVESLVRQNMTRDQARAYARTHGAQIIAAQTARLQQQMTPEQRAALYRDAETNAGLGAGRGGARTETDAAAAVARRNMFGENAGVDTQDAFLRVREQFRTTSNDPRVAGAERNYMMSRSLLVRRLNAGASGSERERINRQLDELDTAARARGVNVDALQNQVTRGVDELASTSANRSMAEDFVRHAATQTGAQILGNMGNQVSAMDHGRLYERMRTGFSVLAGGNNPLAEVLRGAGAGDASQVNTERIFAALRGMSQEQLDAQTPEMRRAIQDLSSNNPRAVEAAQRTIQAQAYGSGVRAVTLGQEYQRRHGIVSQIYNKIFHGGEEGYIQRNLGRSTEADRRAAEQTGQVGLLESIAQDVGLGGNRDMAEAATQLRAAAEALQSVVGNGGLDAAINPNP
jgi:hypothetical protein